jgi:hypothetical protein
MAWVILSIPPVMVATLTPMPAPNASNCSAIWNASSRVGDKTQANSGVGVPMSACKMGRANAAVLPDPVSARPMMSRPARASGMAAAWMGVGCVYLSFSHAWHSSGIIPRDANVAGAAAPEVSASIVRVGETRKILQRRSKFSELHQIFRALTLCFHLFINDSPRQQYNPVLSI